MDRSKIEELICDDKFQYLHPWFYNHPYALRCELGIGESAEAYLANARKRAMEIYDILFPNGADAILFNYWMQDHSTDGEAEKDDPCSVGCSEESIRGAIDGEMEQLTFLLSCQSRYRHRSVRNLQTYDDPEDQTVRRNRVICYSDGKGFDHLTLMDRELSGNGHEVGFVSFQNECIFSIYDDRGCDIVFATHEKMKEFYPKLQKFFLAYDAIEMEKRYNG